jgi:hypothetical protein
MKCRSELDPGDALAHILTMAAWASLARAQTEGQRIAIARFFLWLKRRERPRGSN